MASTADRVRLHYHRPPDREEVFDQRVLARTPNCVVTLLEQARPRRTFEIGGRVVLEEGSPVVWFTFPGHWHDIGRFHTAAGAFTGIYANVLTPVEFGPDGSWSTTDLFLDVWQGSEGGLIILDEHELDAALRSGWVDRGLAAAARAEAARIVARARRGEWPPPIVGEWTLERALAAASAD